MEALFNIPQVTSYAASYVQHFQQRLIPFAPYVATALVAKFQHLITCASDHLTNHAFSSECSSNTPSDNGNRTLSPFRHSMLSVFR